MPNNLWLLSIRLQPTFKLSKEADNFTTDMDTATNSLIDVSVCTLSTYQFCVARDHLACGSALCMHIIIPISRMSMREVGCFTIF